MGFHKETVFVLEGRNYQLGYTILMTSEHNGNSESQQFLAKLVHRCRRPGRHSTNIGLSGSSGVYCGGLSCWRCRAVRDIMKPLIRLDQWFIGRSNATI